MQELAKLAMGEIERRTRELHQRHCHPDYEYIQFTVEGISQKDTGNKEEELIRDAWERQQWFRNSFVMRRRRKGKGEDVQVKIMHLYPPREKIVEEQTGGGPWITKDSRSGLS